MRYFQILTTFEPPELDFSKRKLPIELAKQVFEETFKCFISNIFFTGSVVEKQRNGVSAPPARHLKSILYKMGESRQRARAQTKKAVEHLGGRRGDGVEGAVAGGARERSNRHRSETAARDAAGRRRDE
ncbi:hypothetical protein GWI33_004633 [Rhynchophorus ferrugineus]|uniref:Uncharacterized protein n=1 Tax=Rhynchophorus ferrugineus TaxID=354439 RepID=A0A834IWZ9_RHYFE|nr:hypothetical protein GWI33_004633 [Rhynchophorus ferrugineus]